MPTPREVAQDAVLNNVASYYSHEGTIYGELTPLVDVKHISGKEIGFAAYLAAFNRHCKFTVQTRRYFAGGIAGAVQIHRNIDPSVQNRRPVKMRKHLSEVYILQSGFQAHGGFRARGIDRGLDRN